jgi:hypothetical protein
MYFVTAVELRSETKRTGAIISRLWKAFLQINSTNKNHIIIIIINIIIIIIIIM